MRCNQGGETPSNSTWAGSLSTPMTVPPVRPA